MRPGRAALRRLLVGLAAVCLVGGTLAGLVHRELLDADRFAEHADHVRTDPDVAAALGRRITNRVVAADPDLVAVRPLIQVSATELVGSPAFGGAFRAAVVPLHRALVDGTGDDVVLVLADIGSVLVGVVSAAAPDVAAALPANLDVRLSQIREDDSEGRLVDLARTTTVLAWLLPVLAILLVAGAAATWQGSRLRAFARLLGVALLSSAVVTGTLLIVLGVLAEALDRGTLKGAVIAAAWDDLAGPAWTATAMVAAAGYVLWASAPVTTSLRPRVVARSAESWLVARPTAARGLLSRALVLGAIGALLVVEPGPLLRLAAAVAGALLLVEAALAVGAAARSVVPALGRAVGQRWQRAAPWLAVGVGAALVAALVAVAAWPTADRMAAAVGTGPTVAEVCNGHAELCDRRYDQVSFAATHNSMSAADAPGWFFAEQPTGVLGQLDDGVRTFLIDSWYGQPTERSGVVASPEATLERGIREATEAFGAAAVQSALRLRADAGLQPNGPVAPYLCHALCELGSTAWEPLMVEVRGWLDLHPAEVVTFIVQDEVSPADTAELVDQAGLKPYVHLQEAGEPWPTLAEMIESGRRVVFFMEHRDGGAANPWLMDVNEWVQDTPFDFDKPSDFSCETNRGRAGAPLLLVNHWLSSKLSRVSSAALVNAKDVLGARVRRCERQRGLQPTFVAVDFYDQGDLFGVVDRLNGI